MDISANDVKKSLALSSIPTIGEVIFLQMKSVKLDSNEFLTLPESAQVLPLVFESSQKIFGGIIIDFILEKSGKAADPFVVESALFNAVESIKNNVGFRYAKLFNPVPGSTSEIEGLPCGTGDLFIFEL